MVPGRRFGILSLLVKLTADYQHPNSSNTHYKTLGLAFVVAFIMYLNRVAMEVGEGYSGSISAVMNTLENLGGAFSSVVIRYVATRMVWNWSFLAASAMCLMAAFLATRINPNRSAVESQE